MYTFSPYKVTKSLGIHICARAWHPKSILILLVVDYPTSIQNACQIGIWLAKTIYHSLHWYIIDSIRVFLAQFEYPGINRNTLSGLKRNIMDSIWISWTQSEYPGLNLNIMDIIRISWNQSEYHGLNQNIMDSIGISWTQSESHWLNRNIMNSIGKSWTQSEYPELNRKINWFEVQ
jgi:hypothetical protein